MTQSKRKWPVILAIGFVVVFIAAVAYSTLGNAQYKAEVCVTFKGTTICRDGAGATKENAERVGLDLACTDFGGGMTPFMQCEQKRSAKSELEVNNRITFNYLRNASRFRMLN